MDANITTAAISNNSLPLNVSQGFGDVDFRSKVNTVAVVGGSFNTFFALTLNPLVLLCILRDKELRNTYFFWNVISLSVANIFCGLTVIPFSTNIYHVGKWYHGDVICKAFIISDYTQLPLAMTILMCTYIHCLLESISTPANTTLLWYRIVRSKTFRWILVIIPWCFAILCAIALLLGERKDFGKKSPPRENSCIFLLKKEFNIPFLITMNVCPLFLLIIISIGVSILYIVRIRSCDAKNPLRQCVFVTIIMSFVYAFTWVPFTSIVIHIYTCHCILTRKVFIICIILTCLSPSASAAVTFLHPLLRMRMRSVFVNAWRTVTGYFGPGGEIAVKWTSGDPKLIKCEESVPSDF